MFSNLGKDLLSLFKSHVKSCTSMMFSKKNRMIRKMGYYNDQQGILNRYNREDGGWDSHIENTKSFILESSKDKKGTVAILGSGWLLDVPIEELSSQFEKVYLFDIAHPKQVQQKVKKLTNVEMVEYDLTGGAVEYVYEAVREYKKNKTKVPLSFVNIENFKFEKQIDYIVSVNLLNQLDILVTDYIKKQNIYDTNEIKELQKEIQQKHIASLPEGKSCIITDYEELIYSSEEIIENINPSVYTELPTGKDRSMWKWDFDKSQTYYENKKTIFNVIGIDV